jgi:hypothetical protein
VQQQVPSCLYPLCFAQRFFKPRTQGNEMVGEMNAAIGND